MSSFNILPKGKVVLISGASRGIGKAIAKEFLENGAQKVYAGVRNRNSLLELQARYRERLILIDLDVTDDDSIASAAEKLKDVDILVNNAGVFHTGGFFENDAMESLKKNLDVNVWGVAKLTKALIGTLRKKEASAIVNIASVVGLASIPPLGTYSATKAVVHSMTQGMRGDLSKDNIFVAGVYPGAIDTDMTKDVSMDKESPENVAKAIIEGLIEGQEDIFPDPMSLQVGQNYLTAPKKLEKEFSQFMAEA